MKRILKIQKQHQKQLQIKDLNHLNKKCKQVKTFKKTKRKQKRKNILDNIPRSQRQKKVRKNAIPMKQSTVTIENMKKKSTKTISCNLSFDQSSLEIHRTNDNNVSKMLRMTILTTQARSLSLAAITQMMMIK